MRNKTSFITELFKFIIVMVCLLNISTISYDLWIQKWKEKEQLEKNKVVLDCSMVVDMIDTTLSYAKILEKQGKHQEASEVRKSIRYLVETCK